ncbi:unnamed protein product [Staurois parvus]|uniref:Uncharacterized protein n=1 Tax=Staurois parvus TaxID=386267 RepID=A0ABN9HEL0_9NEOB|nr:unnamed protein product [Staurois parvus]
MYVQERSVEGMTVAVGCKLQERSVEGMTVGCMYRRGVWRVWTVGSMTGEECGGYDSGMYVQESSVEGMTVGSMYRRGVWRV